MFDANNQAMGPGFGKFEQLVKIKGGEYFLRAAYGQRLR